MFPKTRIEAETKRYGAWSGQPQGARYNPECCAYEVPYGPGSYLFRQCSRKPGYGPDGIFCRQHAKVVARGQQ